MMYRVRDNNLLTSPRPPVIKPTPPPPDQTHTQPKSTSNKPNAVQMLFTCVLLLFLAIIVMHDSLKSLPVSCRILFFSFVRAVVSGLGNEQRSIDCNVRAAFFLSKYPAFGTGMCRICRWVSMAVFRSVRSKSFLQSGVVAP